MSYAELIDSAGFGGAGTPSVSGAENIAGLFAMTTRRFPAGSDVSQCITT